MDSKEYHNFRLGRLKLHINSSLIVQYVIFEDIIDSLYSNIDELSADIVQEVLNTKAGNETKMRKLLKFLETNEVEDVYEWFHKALVDVDTAGCDEVATILENTKITEEHISDSNEELLKKGILGVSELIKEMQDGYNDKEPFEIPYNTSYNSSAHLTKDSMKEFVPFHLKKKTIGDKLKDIPVYIGLSIINIKPKGMSAEYQKYTDALEVLHKGMGETEESEIEKCIENLLQGEIKGYEPVVIIAHQMFDECNLGRVVTWFRFWKRFVSSIEGSEENLMIFCKYIGFYLHKIPSYQEWAVKGWDEMLERANRQLTMGRYVYWMDEIIRHLHVLLRRLYNHYMNHTR